MLKHFTFYPPFLSRVISIVSKLKKCDLKSLLMSGGMRFLFHSRLRF